MKRQFIVAVTLAGCAGLASCVAPRDASELSVATVQYACGPGNVPLTVQYTFQGTEPLAAKVMDQNQSVDLTRVVNDETNLVGNTFRGNGYTWTTDKFTSATVGTANGSMLTREGQQTAAGQTTTVNNILARECRPTGQPANTRSTTKSRS